VTAKMTIFFGVAWKYKIFFFNAKINHHFITSLHYYFLYQSAKEIEANSGTMKR
jgi:hypothetical protein